MSGKMFGMCACGCHQTVSSNDTLVKINPIRPKFKYSRCTRCLQILMDASDLVNVRPISDLMLERFVMPVIRMAKRRRVEG